MSNALGSCIFRTELSHSSHFRLVPLFWRLTARTDDPHTICDEQVAGESMHMGNANASAKGSDLDGADGPGRDRCPLGKQL